MKLTPIACAVVLLGTVAAALRAAPDATPSDPFADPAAAKVGHDSSLGAGFANFCRENPSAPAPVGEKPLWFEYVIVEIEHQPNSMPLKKVPVAKLLAEGRGEWGVFEAHTNSSAETSHGYTLERAPDGRLLDADERREVGTSICVHLFPMGKTASLRLDRSMLDGWIPTQGGSTAKPIYSTVEIDTKVPLVPTWVVFGGCSRTVSEPISDTTLTRTVQLSMLIYVRLIDEKPKAAPETIELSGTTVQTTTSMTR